MNMTESTDQKVLLRTPHGSRLYGTSHDHSDEDYFVVVDVGPTPGAMKYAKQKIDGDDDSLTCDLSTFMRYCDKGTPQFLEAAYSREATVDLLGEDFRHSYRPNVWQASATYRRTIKSMWYKGWELDDDKFKRHAHRLAYNLQFVERGEYFDPHLPNDVLNDINNRLDEYPLMKTTLHDLFDADEFSDMVDNGLVSVRYSADEKYGIANYTPATQYAREWNDVTLQCRGLIFDLDTYEVIARPWKKFFNLGEVDVEIDPNEVIEVTDKADGSLGILYPVADEKHAVATRGSFASDQAIHATEVWNKKHQNALPTPGYTFLFEIVYAGNRIVLDYGDMDDLILLGVVANDTGDYYGPSTAARLLRGWDGPVVETFGFNNLAEAVEGTGRDNAEGFIVRQGNTMVKIKEEYYLEIHRLRFAMTPKKVWEIISEGGDIVSYTAALPDEFQDEVDEHTKNLYARFDEVLREVLDEFNGFDRGLSRKDFALALSDKDLKHRSAMFMMYDQKPVTPYIWKTIKPKEETK